MQMKLEGKLDEISNLQSMAKNITQVIRETPSGTPSAVSRIESAVIGIEQKSEELAKELVRTMEARSEIAFAIAQVENPTERCLLEWRYVYFWKWEEIARRLNYSLDHVFTLHKRALQNFGKCSLTTILTISEKSSDDNGKNQPRKFAENENQSE